MPLRLLPVLCIALSLGNPVREAAARPADGPIRVLFLGHDSGHHHSIACYPLLAKALGREAIYFDYEVTVEAALGDAEHLDRFDAVLLHADHGKIEPHQWKHLEAFVENGGGFLPIHGAGSCFGNEPGFGQLVGGRFDRPKGAILRPKSVKPDHATIRDAPGFEAWNETYAHRNPDPEGRTILQVREVAGDDNITEAEPWTWIREQGKGRVFCTASGHDERAWSLPEFHELLRKGILWAVGDGRRANYERFVKHRTPLTYRKADNIPNYEKRPEPLPIQDPLSPEDSLKYTHIRAEFDLRLFAAEPDIVNPICLAWDARGRLWVAETVDYPNDVRDGSGNDTIKILEDTDGDGACDQVTVFADGLNIPTSLTFWNGGVIVAQAPDFLFLKDEDGDDRADVKTTLFTGWGINDTHAGPSNLRYGIDNWIYGAVGYAGFNGEIGGKRHRFGSGIFRFRPDGSEIEFLHQFNNNTWGLGLNAAGDVFGSTANRNPAFFGGFPQTGHPGGKKAMSAKMIADRADFCPITPNIRQVDAFGLYTAGAGYALATSANFPPAWRDRMAFIGGPTGNLLGMFEHVRDGAGYAAKNRCNLIASADEWFSPVAAEGGPDGNLWVADWYNFIIQHNPTPTAGRGGYDAVRGKGNAHENPNRDRQHGRIYRAIWKGAEKSEITSLSHASEADVVAALGSDNQFWRLTAQRIVVAERRKALAPKLRAIIRGEAPGGRASRPPDADDDKSPGAGGTPVLPVAAAHALWTLDGLGLLDRDTHQLALLNPDPLLKRNAIRAIPHTDEGMQLFFDTAVVQARDPLVRLAAFAKLAHFPDRERVEFAARQLAKDPENGRDEWLQLALRACGAAATKRGKATFTGPNLLPNPSFEEVVGDLPADWKVRTYSGEAVHAVDPGMARTGKNSLRISSTEGSDASMFAAVKVQPGTDYKLAGWVRVDGELMGARGAQLNAHEVQGQEGGSRTNAFKTTGGEWKPVEIVFHSMDRNRLTINALFGGWGKSKGVAWWDDVSLQQATYEDIERSGEAVNEGDPAAGRKIFHEHQIAACIRCHMVGGQGGPIGPPLDGIASRKEADYIRRSLVDPMAEIAEGFQAEVSPMPPMGVLLKPQELEDVLAYLATLTE